MFEALFGGCFGQCGGCCFFIAIIALIACVLVGGVAYFVYTQGPEPPTEASFKPSASDAQAFENEIARATNQASQEGWFYIQLTEDQIGSWMALEGEDFAAEHGYDFPFEDVQVSLDDGKITVFGELTPLGVNLPAETVVKPKISSSGEVDFDITSVDVGGVRLPDAVVRSVKQQFEEALLKPFNDLPGTPVFYEQTLTIEDGVFAVQGLVN